MFICSTSSHQRSPRDLINLSSDQVKVKKQPEPQSARGSCSLTTIYYQRTLTCFMCVCVCVWYLGVSGSNPQREHRTRHRRSRSPETTEPYILSPDTLISDTYLCVTGQLQAQIGQKTRTIRRWGQLLGHLWHLVTGQLSGPVKKQQRHHQFSIVHVHVWGRGSHPGDPGVGSVHKWSQWH